MDQGEYEEKKNDDLEEIKFLSDNMVKKTHLERWRNIT